MQTNDGVSMQNNLRQLHKIKPTLTPFASMHSSNACWVYFYSKRSSAMWLDFLSLCTLQMLRL